jgi:hypothetical protein
VEHLHSSLSIILCDGLNQHFLAIGLAMADLHLLCHDPGHHAALIIPHQTSPHGVIKGEVFAHHYCNIGDLCRAL